MKFFKDENEANMTPVIEGFRCKASVFGIFFGLVILPVLIGVYIWYEYGILFAIGTVLFLYIVSSIIGSKLRLSSLPPKLREKNLSSLEIARWFVHQHICF